MYICKDCGNYTKYWSDGYCSSCWGELVEARKCKRCGEFSAHNICKDCLKEEMTLENAIEYSRECGHDYEIKLPDFFEIYTEKEIEEILIKHILSTEHKEQRSVDEYCENGGCFDYFIETKIEKGEI